MHLYPNHLHFTEVGYDKLRIPTISVKEHSKKYEGMGCGFSTFAPPSKMDEIDEVVKKYVEANFEKTRQRLEKDHYSDSQIRAKLIREYYTLNTKKRVPERHWKHVSSPKPKPFKPDIIYVPLGMSGKRQS